MRWVVGCRRRGAWHATTQGTSLFILITQRMHVHFSDNHNSLYYMYQLQKQRLRRDGPSTAGPA